MGHLEYCESVSHRLWISHCRVRNETGAWKIWYSAFNRDYRAGQATTEYGCRFTCEEGFCDTKVLLGFGEARVHDIQE
ncbi:MAG: hypothetical protein WCF84_17610 [Anaerolineae bacterium]